MLKIVALPNFGPKVPHLKSKQKVQSVDVNISASDLNHYFLSITKSFTSDLRDSSDPTIYLQFLKDTPLFEFTHIDESEVLSVINNLNVEKATGFDMIPAVVIKNFSTFIVKPISVIINRSLDSGIVPDIWKRAIITPIQKKRNVYDHLSNYRPISILPIFSKVLEKIVQSQLQIHLSNHDLLSYCQSGFRSQYSTQDLLLYITDSWKRAIDNKELVGAVFLDLSKAFDSINHSILLSKLSFYGIKNASLRWFSSYICDCYQAVRVENNISGSPCREQYI